MDDITIIEFSGRDAVTDPSTDLLRKGARELLQAAVEAERDAFLAEVAQRRTTDGRAALKMLLGPDATGFSAKTISRLKGQWAAEYDDCARLISAVMNGSMSGLTGFTAACAARRIGFACWF